MRQNCICRRPTVATGSYYPDSDLLALGTTHLAMDTPFVLAEALWDHLIELISVCNLRHRPQTLFALFRNSVEAHSTWDMSLLGPCRTTVDPSPCSLGGCYRDVMDLPPYSCLFV